MLASDWGVVQRTTTPVRLGDGDGQHAVHSSVPATTHQNDGFQQPRPGPPGAADASAKEVFEHARH